MSKRVVDLTAEELDTLAAEAWDAAAQEALARGFPVTGSQDGRRLRYHPDGRVEDLGPAGGKPAALAKEPIAFVQKVADESSEPAISHSRDKKSVA